MKDENNKNNPIESPMFKLGKLNFYLKVIPELEEGYAGFYTLNDNKVEGMISMELKENTTYMIGQPGRQGLHREPIPIEANEGWGWKISHDSYRQWAAENGDVFKITATVNLHLKEGSSEGREWTTLR